MPPKIQDVVEKLDYLLVGVEMLAGLVEGLSEMMEPYFVFVKKTDT